MASRPISETNPNTRSGIILVSITISASLIFIVTLIYIIYYLWGHLFRRSRTNPFDSLITSHTLNKLQKFSFKELNSASNSFSSDNFVGKGGSGTVFRGILANGKSVAIKKLDPHPGEEAEREFYNELNILGSINKSLLSSSYVIRLLGYCVEKDKRLLVYEYMPNHSLQERLFSDDAHNCMSWEMRFRVLQDVAKALDFLHNHCHPPVIHSDIKPSNVLLDWEFKAKLSDFGLSRVKVEVEVEDEVGIDMFSQELSGNLSGGEVDFALALQSSTSCKKTQGLQSNSVQPSSKGKEVLVEEYAIDLRDQEMISGVEPSKEVDDVRCVKQWGKDWWWKQDDSAELCSKDYVNEWIGTQVGASTERDWENIGSPMGASLDSSPQLNNKLKDVKDGELPVMDSPSSCLDETGFEQKGSKAKNTSKSRPRKMQDWWKEEQLDEMNNRKGSKRRTLRSKMKKTIKMPHFRLSRRFYYLLRRRISRDSTHLDDGLNHGEYSFKRGKRRKNAGSMGSEVSGDLFSRELSSTTSMRGTLCYVAPEYGGCGYLMEKGDIYSLGVLILVIVSGRRPLHVLNSPMELEKANLVSWCRHLAQAGNVLELVDQRLKDEYDKEKVTMCIHLALACLQRMPELRPDIGDVVKVLRGEMELPLLPFEFSPSPPSKLYSRSRRKDVE